MTLSTTTLHLPSTHTGTSLAAPNLSATTRRLLAYGMISGPLFIGLAFIQVLTRPGFDLRRDAISLLSLGDLGWIQITNFIVSGLLAVGLAVGMRRALHPGRASTWGPLLVGTYGIGMCIGGLFTTDPSFGFPPGAPAGMPADMSWHAVLHAIGFFTAFLSVIPACFVFARRFAGRKQWRWTAYCTVSGVVAPALIVVGSNNLEIAGVLFFVAGVVVCAWLVAMSRSLLAAQPQSAARDRSPSSDL